MTIKKYYQRYKEHEKKYNRQWRKENPNYMRKYKKKWTKQNSQKVKAWNTANRLLKHLKKQGYEFHHSDYSQPLLVEVLPIQEHHLLHIQQNMREANLVS